MAKVQQEILEALKRQSQRMSTSNQISFNRSPHLSHFKLASNKNDNYDPNTDANNRLSKHVIRNSQYSVSEINNQTNESNNNEFNIYKNDASDQENIFENKNINNTNTFGVINRYSTKEKSNISSFSKNYNEKSKTKDFNVRFDQNDEIIDHSEFERI